MFRAFAVHELVLGLEGFAADAVEPCVDIFVDVAMLVHALEKSADERLVPLVGRSDEEVGLSTHGPGQRSPGLGDLVDVRLWREALLLGDPVHLGPVLVDAGEEERVLSPLAMVPNEDVCGDRRVRVPDVRGRVHVVDRRCQVVPHSQEY